MKTVFSVLTILIFSVPSFAKKYVPGSVCGLADSLDAAQNVGKGKDVDYKTVLTSLEKQQLVIAANEMYTDEAIDSTRDAVALMKENSESGDLTVADFKLNGKAQVYTSVIHYPGGNSVGAIFLKGGRTVIGLIGDGDIVCK